MIRQSDVLGKRFPSPPPASLVAVGATGSPPTRPGVSSDPSGGYAGASHSRSDRRTTDRVPNGRPRGAPRPQSAVAKRARSNAIGIRSPSRPVSRATPARPPGARRSVVQGTAAGIGRGSGARAILVWTGLAGRARSEAVCRRWPRRARDRPGASRPRADRSRGPRLTRGLFDPLGARRSVVGRAAPPGSVRRRPRGPRLVVPRIRRISGSLRFQQWFTFR